MLNSLISFRNCRWVHPLVFLPLVACANGTDADTFQTSSSVLTSLRSSFNSIADDYAASCYRRAELNIAPNNMTRFFATLAPAYGSLYERPNPEPSATPQVITAPTLADCSLADRVSEGWSHNNAVVVDYIQTLAALLGSANMPELNVTGNSSTPDVITAVQEQAINDLIKNLGAQVLSESQQLTVASVVRRAQPFIPSAVASLLQIDRAYGNALDAEFNQTYIYYSCLIAAELKSANPISSKSAVISTRNCTYLSRHDYPTNISILLRAQIYAQRTNVTNTFALINRRRLATIAYARVLDDIAVGQDALFAWYLKMHQPGQMLQRRTISKRSNEPRFP